MQGNPLVIVDSLAFTLSIIVSALAAYKAFTSRRVLAAPLYRNRALWTGTMALIVMLFDAWGIFLENTGSSVTYGLVPPYGSPEFYTFVILTASAVAVAFAWIDSTIRVALELDFLHRDAVGWMRLRLVAGVALVAGIVVGQFATAGWELATSIVLLAVPSAYETAALVVCGSRVRDETMRRYMRWMVFLVGSILLQLGTNTVSPYLNFPLAIAAFFLYGISNSLLKTAPLRVATSEIPGAQGQPGVLTDQGPTQGPR
jgi:hypothetical protein